QRPRPGPRKPAPTRHQATGTCAWRGPSFCERQPFGMHGRKGFIMDPHFPRPERMKKERQKEESLTRFRLFLDVGTPLSRAGASSWCPQFVCEPLQRNKTPRTEHDVLSVA